jgi:hypothetical protein
MFRIFYGSGKAGSYVANKREDKGLDNTALKNQYNFFKSIYKIS